MNKANPRPTKQRIWHLMKTRFPELAEWVKKQPKGTFDKVILREKDGTEMK